MPRFKALAASLTSCMVLDELLNLTVLVFEVYAGLIMVPVSQGW